MAESYRRLPQQTWRTPQRPGCGPMAPRAAPWTGIGLSGASQPTAGRDAGLAAVPSAQKILWWRPPVFQCRIRPGPIDDAAAHHGEHRLDAADLPGRQRHDVLGEHREIGEAAISIVPRLSSSKLNHALPRPRASA